MRKQFIRFFCVCLCFRSSLILLDLSFFEKFWKLWFLSNGSNSNIFLSYLMIWPTKFYAWKTFACLPDTQHLCITLMNAEVWWKKGIFTLISMPNCYWRLHSLSWLPPAITFHIQAPEIFQILHHIPILTQWQLIAAHFFVKWNLLVFLPHFLSWLFFEKQIGS